MRLASFGLSLLAASLALGSGRPRGLAPQTSKQSNPSPGSARPPLNREPSGRALPTAQPNTLSSDPDWTLESNQSLAHLGKGLASGDINGDGYSDVIVGAPYYDQGGPETGRVYAVLGGPQGLSTSPNWTVDGSAAGTQLGGAIAFAGDVNGDGYGDVAIGGSAFLGRVYVFPGGPNGPSAGPGWTLSADIQNSLFGWSISSAGDVNADGYDDLVVGAPGNAAALNPVGRVYVYLGSSSGLSAVASSIVVAPVAALSFGASVASADVNGDGYSDVMVGAPVGQPAGCASGDAYVYYGGPTGVSATYGWRGSYSSSPAFGASVSGLGDVNGDGYDDVAVHAPGVSPVYCPGVVPSGYFYYGGSGGLPAQPSGTAFGIAPAGDINRDGYGDVAGLLEGRPAVYFGGATGLSNQPSWVINRAPEYPTYATAAGDIDGDGFGDLLIGAPEVSNWEVGEGRASVFRGGLPDGKPIVSANWLNATHIGVNVLGNVLWDGGSPIIDAGLLYAPYATNPKPEIGGVGVVHLVAPAGSSFSLAVANLTPGTKYAYRTYFSNSVGRTYSFVRSFETLVLPPYVTDPWADDVTESTAALNVDINPNGVATQAAFNYGTNNNLDQFRTDWSDVGSELIYVRFRRVISNLICNTPYRFQPMAYNTFFYPPSRVLKNGRL